MAEKATPRPWRLVEQSDVAMCHIFGPKHPDGGEYAPLLSTYDKPLARLIVQAVNSHDALVDALEAAVAEHTAEARRANFDACGCTHCARFKAALALAKQEAK